LRFFRKFDDAEAADKGNMILGVVQAQNPQAGEYLRGNKK
jgi:hypothetical protein